MRNRLGIKIREFFIGHHLVRAEDSFEEAKIRLIFSFFVAYLIVAMAFIPFLFKYQIRTFTYINLGFYVLYILPFFVLKYSRSYEIPSFLLSCAVVLSASANSVFNNGLLTPNISVWYFIAVAFGAYTLRARYIVALVVIMYICLSIIDWLKYNDLLYINPYFSEKENLDVTPFIMVLTFPLILKLLIEYVRSKQEAISTLKTAMSEKDKILGVVAHDLRNPVGAAVNCIEMCRRHIKKGKPERADKFLCLAEESCQRALGHIDDLLEISTLKADTRQLICEDENLVSFVESIADVYFPQALKKHIKLHFSASDEKIPVAINKLQFSRAIDNVISNAIKFTDEKGYINVDVSVDKDDALICVADNGIGIPEALQETLFTEFTPAAREGTDNEKSTGLGMAITQKIVLLHGGALWFDSKENDGTNFFIRIPRTD